MDDNFKFINSVDPSKCRAKIKERFAKLTLSSNKKKQLETEMSQEISEEIVERRVSRNLLSELLTDDESDKEDAAKPSVQNLLLRSDSSSTIGNLGPGNHYLNATDTTHCSQIETAPEKSLEMEPLMVSCLENTEQLDTEIEKLSSRVSSLAVTNAPPIAISSDESEIVSTQHQRIASGQVCSPVRLRPEFKKEANVSICISSSSDDLQEETEEPIVISDSSDDEDNQEIKPTQQPASQQVQDYEPNVSSIVGTKNSSSNMCAVKANQMAAFLRDVRRNYGLPVDSPDKEFERRQREIATADTEPMTAENDSRSAGTAHRIATADTEPMSVSTEKHPSNDYNRRLALDDTEDMTMANDTRHSSIHYNPVMKAASELLDDSAHRSSDPIPDDSLTIAETSEEVIDESDHEATQTSRKQTESQPCHTSSVLKRSQSLSQHRSTMSSVSSGDTQVQINISAKINIKIQVSQQMDDSSASGLTDSYQSNEKSTSQSIEEQETHNSAQKGMSNHSRAIEEIPHSPPERDVPQKTPEVVPSEDFIDTAQELLNELYGNQWKTPQVLRSLQKVKLNSTSKSVRSKESPRTLVEKEREQTLPTKESTTEPKSRSSGQEFKNPEVEVSKANPEPTDESILGDFSIFRRNIPQDLDSTRLPSKFKEPSVITPISKPTRRQRKPALTSESKPQPVNVTKTRSGREVRQKWRNIVDSDTESEGDNASNDSEHSWEKSNDDEEIENKKPPTNRRKTKRNDLANLKDDDQLVYLDLSKDQVEIQHNVSDSPPANHDEVFKSRLQQILSSCKCEDKPQIKTPGGKTKRKLFSALANEDLEEITPPFDSPRERNLAENIDDESVSISGARMPAKFEPFNKYLESVKTGKPIFKIQTPKPFVDVPKTPKSTKKELREIVEISETPKDKYGFLKSLDLCVGKSNCHPDALYYRDNFRQKKDELATKLYEIYNRKCFNDMLNVPLVWNKKLTNTAGRCMNKKRLGERTCVVELSEKVLTSADRLRCTLIHELCHAATWVLNGESGHGATWKSWARKANHIFPELPKIGVCHQYDIEYKYTYKCVLCGAKSYAHSKSKKVENIRCSYCHGAIEVYLNKKDKEGNAILTPVKEPTGFAKFVKDKYKEFKRPDLKHADVMKLLSNEFASMKVDGNS